MELRYSSERAVQILLSLLKQHNIRKIIASPGSTNITFVATAMHDPWFQMYSVVDERSAAYMACGLSEESGEPVVISCTGATASRNYMPGLTEAFYRQLPILAVTASQNIDKIGHLSPQLIDRRLIPKDIARNSYNVRAIKDEEDEWNAEITINNAILELFRHGGGPVHLNLQTQYSPDYINKDYTPAHKIGRIDLNSKNWPTIPSDIKIGIFVGSHSKMTTELEKAIDRFCGQYNAVVFCDHTSNYYGLYRVQMSLPFEQINYKSPLRNIDLLIHIGNISGDYPTTKSLKPKQVWRINDDGEIRDLFKKITYVFEVPEVEFFNHYATNNDKQNSYFNKCLEEIKYTESLIPELPFSNGWIAQHSHKKIPVNSVVHLGILNSLRNWNYFPFPEGVKSYCNVGGFGIDGIVSTLIGASLANSDKLYFAILGDLAFFYDLNAIGNRHISSNIRIMVINNGIGVEFKLSQCLSSRFGNETDKYIAAGGHYGNKSPNLVKHYAEDLGFEYISASNKEEYLKNIDKFTNPNIEGKPIIFEIFTDMQDETNSFEILRNLRQDNEGMVKKIGREVFGDTGIKMVKKFLKK